MEAFVTTARSRNPCVPMIELLGWGSDMKSISGRDKSPLSLYERRWIQSLSSKANLIVKMLASRKAC